MQTSQDGIQFIERHEGVVLKAYRCPAGVWTIGAGLTAATGVIHPKAGMTITREEASRFLAMALRKYERRVEAAMPGAVQREFDGGVSFDYNTGGIARASWVGAWKARNWAEVKRRLALWKKGGGRVLPGLVRRRKEEFELIRWGNYGEAQVTRSADVKIVVPIEPETLRAIKSELTRLGYDWTPIAIRDFQRDHDLTADGIVGRATLSTLQRRIDARAKTQLTATGGASAVGTAALPADLPSWAPALAIGAAGVIALLLALQYRDVLAAKIHHRAPKAAALLRSF